MRTLILLTFLSGCVSSTRHTRELDAVRQERAKVETDLQLARAEVDKKIRSLDAAVRSNQSLTQRAQDVDDRNIALRGRIVELGTQLDALSTNSAADASRREQLQKMVAGLQSDADAAQRAAAEAREEAAAIEAERARLQAERDALQQKTGEYDRLLDELATEIARGDVKVTEELGRLVVNLSSEVLFSSGATDVKADGKAALIRVAKVLENLKGRDIRVEGHTDDVQVQGSSRYEDNWQLSALRATNVVRLLIESGVDPTNIAAVGYGEHRPASDNASGKGRAQNRRIEIVLTPRASRFALPE